MTGMILSHTHELVSCIVEVHELIQLKKLRMGDPSLAINQRATAGKDFLSLVDEYLNYVDELEEIAENYVQQDFDTCADVLDPYLSMRIHRLLSGGIQ